MNIDGPSLWDSVLAELQLTLSGANFQTWFKGKTAILSVKDSIIEIGCANSYNKVWIEERYLGTIKEIVDRVTGQANTLIFKVTAQTLPTKKAPDKKTVTTVPLFEEESSQTIKESLESANINPRYSFANFIVGQSNQLAFAVSKAIVEAPFERYNPLLIHGGVGVGKTHLLQAIAHAVTLRRANAKVLYCSSETFTNDMVEAIQKRQTVDFRDKYRNLDFLLVDDIQFVAGRESTQEEFFHTFNHLFFKGKQIILSCDRDPRQLQNLQERLKSRFAGGMVVAIDPPDLELREAILLSKSRQEGLTIDFSIIRLLAQRLGPSVRDLEGGLLRLIAVAKLTGKEVDESLVKTVIDPAKPIQKPADKVVEGVASFFSLPLSDLTGQRRSHKCVFPRQVAMYLLRQELGLSFAQIAALFGGKDRTTAIYSVSKVEVLMEKGEEIRRTVQEARNKIFSS